MIIPKTGHSNRGELFASFTLDPRTWFAVLLSAILLFISCGFSQRSDADEIRSAYVPADNPEVWPTGRWEALPMDEFRDLIKELSVDESVSPQAILKRVNYTATWSNDSFINGELTADISRTGFDTKYLSLGQPTLLLKDLSWQNRPAVWGTDPEGHFLLRVESDASLLHGRWSLRGRDILGDTEFRASLPPSVISRFELRMPSDKHLHVADGLLAVARDDTLPGWKRWILDLGNKSTLQFVVTDGPQQAASPQLMTQRKSQYRFLPDGLRFRVNFAIENLGGSVQELWFDVPPELPISSIMLGNDTELPFHRVSEEEHSAVVVPLQSLKLNSRTSLTVQGTVPLASERTWKMPRISLKRAHLLESRMSIKVHRPLELSDFSTESCRLISSTMNRNQTDSLDLEDWADTSEVSVTLDTPQADVVSDVLTTISGDLSQSTMRTLLKLTTRSGSVYKLPCFVPPGWKITRATSIPWRRPNIVAQWNTISSDDNGSQLMVEFRDALTPAQTVIIEISARRAADPGATSLAMPLVRPVNAMPQSVAMILSPVAGQNFSVADGSPYSEQTLVEATSLWTGDLEGTQWLVDADGMSAVKSKPFVIFSQAPTETDQLIISPATEKSSATLAQPGTATLSTSAGIGNPEPASQTPSERLVANITVETNVPETVERPCVHTIKYLLPSSAAGTTLRFSLDAPASFIAARGPRASAPRLISDQEVQLELPETADSFDVELEYQSPFSQSLLSGTALIPLPRSDVIRSDVCWRLVLPPSFRLAPSTTGTSSDQATVTWGQRLAGPLGRGSGQIQATSVRQIDELDVATSPSTGSDTMRETDQKDHGLVITSVQHSRSVPYSADVLQLRVWKEDISHQVGWLLMMAGCMGIGLIRRLKPPHGTAILAVCLLGAGLLSVLVSDTYAIPSGGLFFGILAGMLLPHRLWSHRISIEKRPMGSTRRAPVASVAGLSLVILTGWFISDANALQENLNAPSAGPQAAPPSQGAPQYDALIPVKSERPTLEESPVAYVSPALLERWRSRRLPHTQSPDYLLRDAEYVMTFDQRPFPRMSAVFDVVLLNPLMRHIHLPLEGIALEGENACTVNGQTATIIPLTIGRGISIDLHSANPPPLPPDEAGNSAFDSDSTPDIADERMQVLRVVISCHVRSRETSQLKHVDTAIPKLLSTTALLHHSSLDTDDLSVNRFGSQALDPVNHSTMVDLGPVERLQIDLTQRGTNRAADLFEPQAVQTSVIVHPQRLEAHSRLTYMIKGPAWPGTDVSIELNLPPNALVREVRAIGLQSWKARHREAEPVALRLTFSAPPSAQYLVVDIEYVLPGVLATDKVTIPAFTFPTKQQSADFPPHSLGLSAATGFRIDHLPALHQSSEITRLTLDQFRQEWGVGESINLELGYSFIASRPLGVKLTPLVPELRTSVSERIVIDPSGSQWQGDIEVSTQGAPVALYRVSLTPGIEITNASVTHDGAEILTRWTRLSDHQLILYVANEVTGNQKVRLAGLIPLTVGEQTRLADFAIENAAVSEHTLTLQNHPDFSFEAFDSLEQPLSTQGSATGLRADSTRLNEQTFDMLSGNPPKIIQVDEVVSTLSFERLVTVDTTHEHQWQLTTQLLLPLDQRLPHQIQVVMPGESVNYDTPVTSFPAAEQSTVVDGRPVLTFTTNTPEFESRRIDITLAISPKRDVTWEIPQVDVVNSVAITEWLLLMSDSTYDLGQDEMPVPVDGIPDRFTLPSEFLKSGSRAYRSADESWTLIPGGFTGTDGFVRQMDTVIWDADSREFCGVTSAQISVRRLDQLSIPLPAGLQITHLEWDGGTLSSRHNDASRNLIVPLSAFSGDSDKFYELKLWWTLPKTSISMQCSIPLLKPERLPVVQQRIALLGSGDSRYEVTDSAFSLETPDERETTDRLLSNFNPLIRPLRSAGYFSSGTSFTKGVNSILVGTFENGSSEHERSTIPVWKLNRQLRRFLFVLVIALPGLIIGWKTQAFVRLGTRLSSLQQSLFAGPTLLAALLWLLGPSSLGFALSLFLGIGWGMTTWNSYRHATGFEYTEVTTS